MTEIPEIDVQRLHERLEGGSSIVLLDIREPSEWAICRIEGARHLPLSEIGKRIGEIPADRPVVAICHHGVRSELLVRRLRALGYDRITNLRGGIDAWARRIDPTMRRY